MKHKKIKELLPLYIDNGLTTDEKEKVEQHLKECRECQEELQMYRENSHLLSSLDTLKAPAGFVDSIKKRLNQNEINSDSWVEK
ncbi:MAG: anti-sigma factor family protein [Halanaerobiaceae bacterium]